jgi:FHS family Na+ dependent glucose MFS transporter 1
MAGCLVCMAAMMFLAPLMTWLWHLVAVILVLGASDGALDVGGNTLLVWVHGEKVGPFMNGLHFFFGVGAFLSPVIIAQAMLGGGGIGRAYRVLAILLLPGALWLLRLASPAMPARSADSAADRVNGRLVGLIVVFFFFYSGAEIGFGGWIYSYATALHLSSDTVAAYLTSAFWGSLTVGRLLAIPIALRLTPRLVLLIDLLGSLISVCAFLLWPYSLVIAWLGTCGMGLSLASVFPATMCLAQGRMRIRGKVTGWFFVGVSAGGMFLPWFIGQFFESVGPRTTMVILLFDLIGGVALLAVLAFQVGRPVYQWVMGEG